MLFNSMPFIVFFLAVVVIYFLTPFRFRWFLLLSASYFFYMCWRAEYALLLLGSTSIVYLCSLGMASAESKRRRKAFFWIALGANLGLLFFFKYFNFTLTSIDYVVNSLGLTIDSPVLNILLPVGISFYAFRLISYAIDVYRGDIKTEKHFGMFALYVSFFPSLLAGPIDRAGKFLPQLYEEHKFDLDRICAGLLLALWGLYKKVVIADRLAMYADSVFNNIHQHEGLSYIVAAYFYTIQIYCDFSGYSDIAIGLALVLGIRLMQNFNLPYFSVTTTDFWRRWHMSLSTWFRDYVYIPLGGNRQGQGKNYFNLFITMLVCGLWHGAAWTFVVWGGLHGVFLCLSRLTLSSRDRLVKQIGIPDALVTPWRIFITFNIVAVMWIFFRANSLNDAAYIITNLFSGWPALFIDPSTMVHGMIGFIVLLCVEVWQRQKEAQGKQNDIVEKIMGLPLPGRWAVYFFLLFSIILFGVDSDVQFIYFQF